MQAITEGKQKKELLRSLALLAAAALVCLILGQICSDPQTFQATYRSIDDKVETVLMLTAASTIASGAITAIPDDFGTPIATQIAEFTDYLLIILSVLLTEKYLLTMLGVVSFRILIPAACVLSIPVIRRKLPVFREVAVKLAVMVFVLFLVIPVSMGISDMIWDTFQVSIDNTIQSVERLNAEDAPAVQEDTGFIASMWNKVSSSVSSFAEGITHLPQRATAVMNNFIQSIAVMIVTSCIIPLVVLAFAIWIVKQFTGASLPFPAPAKRHRKKQVVEAEAEEEELVTL